MQLQASKKSSSAEDPTKPSQDLVVSNGGLRKGFSSTPDLKSTTEVPLIPLEELKIKIGVKTNVSKTDLDLSQPHHMQDDGKVGDQRGYFTLPGRRSKKLPPPDHAPPPPPPPPPPSSEVMLVKSPEKTSPTKNTSPIMSSFKPDDPQTQPQSG